MSPTSTGITAFPSYRINEEWSGFGLSRWVSKPDSDYTSYYLGKGFFYSPAKWVHIWGGLIAVYTDSTGQEQLTRASSVCRPQVRGIERQEVALLQLDALRTPPDRDAGYRRVENSAPAPQSDPHRDSPRGGRPRMDAEVVVPAVRRRTHLIVPTRGRSTRCACASALATSPASELLVEFHYFVQYTRPDSGALPTRTTFSA